jgi:hypothetical protein
MIGLLSIPTWIIHAGSIIEWALAMALFYAVGRRMKNKFLMWMPVAMIPFMFSGFCAFIFHITEDKWNFINELQTYLTFAGSCGFALWAFLLLRSLTVPEKEVKRG